MAAPIVSWYEGNNSAEITNWAIGVVDAGSVSTEKQMLIWNNRGGSSAVSNMTNCTITTKDSSGGDTGELVLNTWIEVQVNSMGEVDFTPIGGTTTKVIEASGVTAGVGEILGTINDGTVANSPDNFADVTLRANVPSNATAGNISFLTRVSYQYV